MMKWSSAAASAVPLRVKVTADERISFTVMFEPLGVTYDLAANEYMFFEIGEFRQGGEFEIIQWPGGISIWAPGPVTTFDANGTKLDELN